MLIKRETAMFDKLNGYKTVHELGQSFNSLLISNSATVPGQDELMLYQAINRVVIENGLHYTTDVYEAVVSLLSEHLSKEELAYGIERVEHGDVGMMIYYMRKIVVANSELLKDKQAIMDPKIGIGLKLKNVQYGRMKFSTMVIEHVNKMAGDLTFTCSRRGTSAKYSVTIGASSELVQTQLSLI